jgi:hypothetical protein
MSQRGESDLGRGEGDPSADRARLRERLGPASAALGGESTKLKAACVTYRTSLGKNGGPVLAQLATLQRLAHRESRAISQTRVSTPVGRHARSLVVEALGAYASSLVELECAFRDGTDAAKAKRAVAAAESKLARGRKLQSEASSALGFTWRI